jgi:ubiquinone/menaquinone biosynthesis C-methylase UbiE
MLPSFVVRESDPVTSILGRYERIAPWYDLLDGPFERGRYQAIRPLLFEGLSGRLLDAGVGTGRNIPFYPAGARVVGIDLSPRMLARAALRRGVSGVVLERMDVTAMTFPDGAFDAAVATFLFCVLEDAQQVPALRELRRVVRPGGTIRLLDYVRPSSRWRRLSLTLWGPWAHWAYGARFDRGTLRYVAAAGLEVVEVRPVVEDLVVMLTLRGVA